jgi:hypothetical protein
VETPEIIVEVGFDLSSVGGPFFTFGASTVTADNPQSLFGPNGQGDLYRLGGTLFYDVTSSVKSVTINRGRSRELDRFTTGSANITFDNTDRAFDPFYSSSPYFPDVKPRRDIRVSTVVNGSTAIQFTGLVEDWNIDYQIDGQSEAFAACVDGFILFGGQQLAAHTATSQTSGQRIGAILDRPEVDWPSSLRDIDTGAQTFQADVIEQGRETLEYLQLVETSEPGLLYMSKDNKVTFRDRNTAAAPGTIVFSDAGTAIPYTNITTTYGTELLYNRATIARIGGTPQTSENTLSKSEYGVVSLELNGLLIDTDANALALSQYLVNKYAEPDLRFDTVSVELAGLGTADQAAVLGLELTDIIRLEYQPAGIGPSVVKDVQILGIRHAIRPGQHEILFNLGSTDTAAFVFGGGTAAASYPFSLFAGGTVTGSPFGL